jgi:hypothetical protein
LAISQLQVRQVDFSTGKRVFDMKSVCAAWCATAQLRATGCAYEVEEFEREFRNLKLFEIKGLRESKGLLG